MLHPPYGHTKWVEQLLGIERTTFIIDSAGKIRKIFTKAKPKGHAAEALAAI